MKRLGLIAILLLLISPYLYTHLHEVKIRPCKVESITIHSNASISAGQPEYTLQAIDVKGNIYNIPIPHEIYIDIRPGDWIPIKIYRNKITKKITAYLHE